MTLLLFHPQVAAINCVDCQQVVYNLETGDLQEMNGRPQRVPRSPRNPAPCRLGKDRCPKGSPEAGRELSTRNWRAYEHYQRCRAVGRFPHDPIVEQNAAIIRKVEDEAAEYRQLKMQLPKSE